MMLLILMMNDGVLFNLVLGVAGVRVAGVLCCLMHVNIYYDDKSWLVASVIQMADEDVPWQDSAPVNYTIDTVNLMEWCSFSTNEAYKMSTSTYNTFNMVVLTTYGKGEKKAKIQIMLEMQAWMLFLEEEKN
ncbi:hypothetical protein TSUD_176850 [Trifolium subterraneum]|uniref:Uncharacterized protein n=1 Tax=Trifolium subterraneum TaxID=3900 RepID=A0A2Z6MS91_TRISU|nr:hypothetical protein TSUD_176850 [Trifolium subterraneum]